MVQKITTIPNPPARGADYDLGDGLYARVVFRVLQNNGQAMLVEMQAYQVDLLGNFVASPTGEPSRTPSTTTEIHLSGCTGPNPTCSLKAGWVMYVPGSGITTNLENLPAGCVTGVGAPTAIGDIGDFYYDTAAGKCYTWHPGALEGPVSDKAIELRSIIVNSAMTVDLSL